MGAAEKFEEYAVLKTITPKMAAEFLEVNKNNRPLKQRHVDFLADQIEKGYWKYNGDTITFSRRGFMLNGQHRCNAIIQANKPIACIIAYNVEDDAMSTIDTGINRGLGDVYSLLGHINVNSLAAVAKLYYWYLKGEPGCNYKVSHAEMSDFLVENPTLQESTNWVVNNITHESRLLKPASTGCAYHIFRQIDEEKAKEFFELFLIDPTTQMRVLEKRLYNDIIEKRRRPKHEALAIIIKTWNAWREDIPIRKVSWKKNETFPVPV